MKQNLCIILLLLWGYRTPAQELPICWDKEYNLDSGEALHATIQSTNGWLIGVGSVEIPGKGANGFFMAVDMLDGHRLYYQPYDMGGNGVITGVAQDVFGKFYLTGYTRTRAKGQRDAWLRYVSTEGQPLEKLDISTAADEWFQGSIMLNDGGVLLVGQRNNDLWLSKWIDNQHVTPFFLGLGSIADVAGMVKTSTGKIWLFGNLKSHKGDKAGWALQIDETGVPVSEELIGIATPGGSRITSVHSGYFGDIVLTGKTFGGWRNDSWIMRLDDNAQEKTRLDSGHSEYDDIGIAAYLTPGNELVGLRQIILDPAIGNVFGELVLKDGRVVERIPQTRPFIISHLVATDYDKIVVLGHVFDGRRQRIRGVCFHIGYPLATSKGDGNMNISCSPPEFIDKSGDGVLSPGEDGAIVFDITNLSDSPLWEAQVKLLGMPTGYPFNSMPLLLLFPRESCKIHIPLQASWLARQQNAQLSIQVLDKGGIPLVNFPFEIKTQSSFPNTPSIEVITKWNTEYGDYISSQKHRIRTHESQIRVQYEALTTRPLDKGNFSTYNQYSYLEASKGESTHFNRVEQSNNGVYRYLHMLTFELPLEDGNNFFVLEINDGSNSIKHDTIHIYREPNRPNLHVIAIGPSNIGLDFTSKDARDFAYIMMEQTRKEYFGQVYIDTLLTKERTTKREISLVFNNLRRYFTGEIKDRRITQDDIIVVFISSHGLLLTKEGSEYFGIMPSDYEPNQQPPWVINFKDDILANLDAIECKKILFIDACHSGAAGVKGESDLVQNYLLELDSLGPGYALIVSSDKSEHSYESKVFQNGTLTYALKACFQVESTTTIGDFISLDEIFMCLAEQVPQLAKQINASYHQNPQCKYSDPNLGRIKFLKVQQ